MPDTVACGGGGATGWSTSWRRNGPGLDVVEAAQEPPRMGARIEIRREQVLRAPPAHGLLDQLLALAVVTVEVFDDGVPEQRARRRSPGTLRRGTWQAPSGRTRVAGRDCGRHLRGGDVRGAKAVVGCRAGRAPVSHRPRRRATGPPRREARRRVAGAARAALQAACAQQRQAFIRSLLREARSAASTGVQPEQHVSVRCGECGGAPRRSTARRGRARCVRAELGEREVRVGGRDTTLEPRLLRDLQRSVREILRPAELAPLCLE